MTENVSVWRGGGTVVQSARRARAELKGGKVGGREWGEAETLC